MTLTATVGENSPSLTRFVNPDTGLILQFQDGPIGEFGVNGTTNEEVIQLLVDRLNSLQSMADRKFTCRENELAITHLEEALHWLWTRTNNRLKRGVEGTNIP